MRIPGALLAALLLPLSGCSGGGGGDVAGSGTPTSGPAGGASENGPPAWALRDWWTYDTPFGESTYVVTDDMGSDWFLDTTNPDAAFLDAHTDVSRLGPQRKSDLAGSQGSDRVEFFRWPLQDGATWTTAWDGEAVTVTATAGDGDGFSFLAENATAPMYRYTYLPAVGWFGELHHLGPDGQPDVSLTLKDSGHDFSGEVVRWRLETVQAGSGEGGTQVQVPFEVGNVTDLWLAYHFECTAPAGYTVAVQPANPGLLGPQGLARQGECAVVDFADVAQAGPHPGTWLLQVSVGGATAAYSFELLLRTLETLPVG